MSPRPAAPFDLHGAPGHLLRRAQQRAVDIFTAEVGADGPTPPQFALLAALQRSPGSSQIALVQEIGIDRSTLADMVRRLMRRGWIVRRRTRHDRRENELRLSRVGEQILQAAAIGADRAQERILGPIPDRQRRQAIALLRLLAEYHEKGRA